MPTITLEAMARRLRRLEDLTDIDADFRPLLKQFSDFLARRFQMNFQYSETSGGRKWKTLSIATSIRKQYRDGRSRSVSRAGLNYRNYPLIRSGLLMAAASAKSASTPGAIRNIGKRSLEYGVSGDEVPYAWRHQEGAGVPRREFMNVTKDMELVMLKMLDDFLDDELEETF